MSPSNLAAVLWDMDGTLLDSERLWDVSLQEFAALLGGVLSPPARAAMVGTSMAATMDILYDDLGVQGRDSRQDAGWLDHRTAELFGEGLVWRPGARELLLAVRQADLRTALVTSTSRPLVDRALTSIGREHFDAIVCGGETAPKPDPAPYRAALEQLGLQPADALVIEDSPTGVASAVAAGCPVLAVPCAVPLAAHSRIVLRQSLAGVVVDDLRQIHRQVSARPA